jgi:hypothetical protein
VAGGLDGVCCVKGVGREGQLAEVAAHHISQGGDAQALVVVSGTVHLVLVDGDACRRVYQSQPVRRVLECVENSVWRVVQPVW